MFFDSDFLHERIEAGVTDHLSEGDEEDFIAWQEILNVSGEQIFARRLASLGLDESRARRLARRIRGHDNRVAPECVQVLREALGSAEKDDRFYDLDQPFGSLWAPVTGYATQQLSSFDGRLVSLNAITDLVRFLHSEISTVAAEPTYLIFDNFRAEGGTFEEFIERQRLGWCEDIFFAYPALARCVRRLIGDWIKTTNLFLLRLETCAHRLSEVFGIPEVRLESVTMGLSDRHAGGYQVILADFGERKVLYKPKDMSLESLLPTINEWLRTGNLPAPFRFPLAIDCGDYGWAEWIDQKPCHSAEEVKQYYRQAGALLCLAHMLNAKDLLFENIVACGSDPVPIDLETFFQPEARTFDWIGKFSDDDHPAYKWKGSVIDVALLPFWQFSSSHPMCDLSGLGCKNENLPPGTAVEWESINTSDMRPVVRSVRPYRTKNEVVYLGKVQAAADFSQEVESGFAEFHRFVVKKGDSLIKFLSRWREGRSRLIFRPTQLYSLLVQKSLRAKNLESGIKRSIVFEQLYRPALKSGHLTPDLQRLFDFERDALLRLDIPRFYISLQSVDLDLSPGNPISGFLWAPPLETVKRRIRHASESSLQYHLEVIRASLKRRPNVVSTPLGKDDQLQLVREYADLIYSKANPEKKSFLWAPASFVEVQLPEIERLAVYSGEIGILVFLAAADRVLRRRTSPALLEHCYSRVETFDSGSAPFGIGNGIGGLIYGSLILAEILEDKSWINLAALVSERLPDDRIRTEREPEILYGVAGLLLAVTKLHQVLPSEHTKRQAALCIRNLVSSFRPDAGWIRPNGDCSLGFAHGTAGIAYALAVGDPVLNDTLGLDTARKAIEFDRQFFDEGAHNWPATTKSGDVRMRAWCSGLPGVLLSRAGVWARSRDSQLLAEIEANIPHLPNLLGLDHWCCGSAGASEVLMCIAKVLGREDLMAAARSIIDQTVRRALKSVYYRFSPELGENYCFEPSLFRGLAGIGYTLIHSMGPFELPCILAFE